MLQLKPSIHKKQYKAKRKMNSLLATGLFALRGAAVISELHTEAKRQSRITVVNAHHSNLLI